MRYDTPIYFEKVFPGKYDEETGDYGEPSVESKKKIASVSDTSEEHMTLAYGGIRQGSKTVSLLVPYAAPFDRIRIGGRLYKADARLSLRRKQVFILSEMQDGTVWQGRR